MKRQSRPEKPCSGAWANNAPRYRADTFTPDFSADGESHSARGVASGESDRDSSTSAAGDILLRGRKQRHLRAVHLHVPPHWADAFQLARFWRARLMTSLGTPASAATTAEAIALTCCAQVLHAVHKRDSIAVLAHPVDVRHAFHFSR
ncbi:hypothetical protein KCP77_07100 [Salmonella enterica subsp. enterica]|nr:hypothetical protein KCP77_07100 [Salmonella enterica subsp. enterica]